MYIHISRKYAFNSAAFWYKSACFNIFSFVVRKPLKYYILYVPVCSQLAINSLILSDVCMRQKTRPSLVRHLFGAKPLYRTILAYCKVSSMNKFQLNLNFNHNTTKMKLKMTSTEWRPLCLSVWVNTAKFAWYIAFQRIHLDQGNIIQTHSSAVQR